jgi:hypothetical protein
LRRQGIKFADMPHGIAAISKVGTATLLLLHKFVGTCLDITFIYLRYSQV